MNRTSLIITYRWAHGLSDTHIDVTVAGEGADVGDKTANKALTGAYKYALRQTLMIETGDDPDKYPSAEPTTVIPQALNDADTNELLIGKQGSDDARGATSPAAQAQRGRPLANGNDEDIDHLALALAATSLQGFAAHAFEVLDGYPKAEAVVGALVHKYPEAHGLERFVYSKNKNGEYMEWLAERKNGGE